MISDKLLLIPVLSKELALIGQPGLPFKLKKSKKTGNDSFRIVFESKSMIEALTSVCLDLVKQIKLFGEKDDDELNKISFANSKLEKQIKFFKSEMNKTEKALAIEKESNRQLQEKVTHLQQQIKNLEINEKKMMQRNQTAEDQLKHSLKKKDSEVVELHKILWKQFNLVDKDFLPGNFTIMVPDEPDFKKLWSEVKYSDVKTKEYLLKKAVCILQANNTILTQDNLILKTFLLSFLQEMNETQKLMREKMKIPDKVLNNIIIEDIFPDRENLNFPLYKSVVNKHLNFLENICTQFEKAVFSIGDDVFVCWSDVLCKLLGI